MQRTVGNANVQRLITRSIASRPDTLPHRNGAHPLAEPIPIARRAASGTDLVLSRQNSGDDAKRKREATELEKHIPTLKSVAETADGTFHSIIAKSEAGVESLDEMSLLMTLAEILYMFAYSMHEAKVNEINAKALPEDVIGDAILGIAIGVGVAFALPEVAAGAIALKIVAEVGGELAELGIGEAVKAGGEALTGPPPATSTAGPPPAEARASNQETITNAQRELMVTVPQALEVFHDISAGARKVITDIPDYEDGENKWSYAKLSSFVKAFKAKDADSGKGPTKVNEAVAAINA